MFRLLDRRRNAPPEQDPQCADTHSAGTQMAHHLHHLAIVKLIFGKGLQDRLGNVLPTLLGAVTATR